MKIAGKHALVTGGAKRVARVISENLAKRGAKLSLHYHTSKAEAEAFVDELRANNVEAQAFQADLRDAAQIESSVKKLGPIDILINSASVFFPTPASTVTSEIWDDVLDPNLKGQFFFAKACAASMKTGVIINIADVNHPVKNYAPYCASKGGLLSLSRALALEWAPKIRVNSICPGPILFPESYSEEKKAKSVERTLLKRAGNPQDIADGCVFLIENDYLTGMDLVIDGGRSLT